LCRLCFEQIKTSKPTKLKLESVLKGELQWSLHIAQKLPEVLFFESDQFIQHFRCKSINQTERLTPANQILQQERFE